MSTLEQIIENAWDNRDQISLDTSGEIRDAVDAALDMLDNGTARVASPTLNAQSNLIDWSVNQWLKKAVLLSFRLNDNQLMGGAPNQGNWWDKVPGKFDQWTEKEFREAGFRAVPPAMVRRGAYIAPNAILMPSYVNFGAYVGSGTMIDTWATVGSCAQIGANCHISGGTGIGGVLEPLQANPVIIEDNVFIGARSEVAEGVIVRTGAVISMGVFLGASTKIVDRATGQIHYGEVPPFSVVVPGTMPSKGEHGIDVNLSCAVIVKTVDERTRSKTSVNELLRD